MNVQRNNKMAEEQNNKNETKNIPSFDEFLKIIASREKTPSEKIVNLAKERDRVYDAIKCKTLDLEKAKSDNEEDEVEFIEKSIAALKEQKDVLTKRIKTLLDET